MPANFMYYTAGWISTAISRDNGNMFAQYNTDRIQLIPLFSLYKPSAEYDVPLTALQNNDFTSFDERDAFFNQAIPMHMAESWHGAMTNDNTTFSPFTTKISVAADLAAGIAGTTFWPYTLRINGQEGGTGQGCPIRTLRGCLEPDFRIQLDRRHHAAARHPGLGFDVRPIHRPGTAPAG